MTFKDSYFIKPDITFCSEYKGKNPAPLFRKGFSVHNTPSRAELSVCGLGYAYCFINGKRVTEDLFCAPVSDYRKTLWYVTYDVSELIGEGENLISVICGNGWYNEEFPSSWNHNTASWRDLPKFILELKIDGKTAVVSDDTWKCLPESAIVFNALRSGEVFDARSCDKSMICADYDDTAWKNAARDTNPPQGSFRKCLCEPIREHEVFSPVSVLQTAKGRFVYDMGQNISGYVRLTATGTAGQEITVRYAEQLTPDNERELNHMFKFYPESPIQTDRFICSGEKFTWSPMFTYHGFRYIELEGIDSADEVEVRSVFVHQDIKKRTAFECSDDTLNTLFRAGQFSSYSNMFYLISDCPSREKMGWLNDIHMTCEQFCTDFYIEKLLKKWLVDIQDAMRDDGAMSGIAPTHGWGYAWGNGPLSDGALFEIPYRLWLHSKDSEPLVASVPYFERYLEYLKTLEDEEGQISYGLDDWAPPHKQSVVPITLINDVLRIKFYRIYSLALHLKGEDTRSLDAHIQELVRRARECWIADDGGCKINELTAIALFIAEDISDKSAALSAQLKARFEELGFHHNCGMLGMRYLFDAFNICGLEEYAMKLLTAEGFPTYRLWLDNGATTLWEKWFLDNSAGCNSRNHHMYSYFMAWLISTVLGIKHLGGSEFEISPYFFEHLTFAKGSYSTDGGELLLSWHKDGENTLLDITLTGDVSATYEGELLTAGKHTFRI